MSALPSYGSFFEKPKARDQRPQDRAGGVKGTPPAPPLPQEEVEKRQLAAIMRCCYRRDIAFTVDETSAICRTCGTIMPASWVEDNP